MLTIGWFSTGRGPGSRGLLRFVQDRILGGRLEARIQFVFSNREPGEAEGSDQFFELVHGYGLPLYTRSSAEFRRARGGGSFARHRDDYDAQVLEMLRGCRPDICVLAGYMLIAGGALCRQFPLLNLHPALPDGPIGTWQEVIWQLIQQRASHTGAMMHLATQEVDRGPLVSYCTAPITGGEFDPLWRELEGQDLDQVRAGQGEKYPLFQLIRQAEYRREPYLVLETLRAVSQGRAVVLDGKVLSADGRPLGTGAYPGLCLDREIDRSMGEDEVI